jgi:hypothetical protein
MLPSLSVMLAGSMPYFDSIPACWALPVSALSGGLAGLVVLALAAQQVRDLAALRQAGLRLRAARSSPVTRRAENPGPVVPPDLASCAVTPPAYGGPAGIDRG